MEVTTPCDRCGTFAALTYYGDQALCPTCLDRLEAPFGERPFGIGTVLKGTASVLGPVWWRSAGLSLVLLAPIAWWQIHWTSTVDVPNIVRGLLGLVPEGVAIVLTLDVLAHRPARLGRAVSRILPRMGDLVISRIAVRFTVFLFALLFIVPGVIRGLGYLLVTPSVAAGESSGIDGLGLSRQRMEGHRAEGLVLYLVASLPLFALFVSFVAVVVFKRLAASPLPPTGLHEIEVLYYLVAAVILPLPAIVCAVMYAILRRRPYLDVV